jgi:hypothetical protein
MKSWIGLRITAEIDGNGPALLRRLLPEIGEMIAKGEFGAKVPDQVRIGDVLVELGAGPVPPAPISPDAEQGGAVEVEVRG